MLRERFGALPDGRVVEAITLSGPTGLSARIITYGASIHSVWAPDRDGHVADIALGHSTIEEYLSQPQYFGSTVGRVANRIAGGGFTLDGTEYRLPQNNGANTLHGGETGFDKAVWEVVAEESRSVTLRHVSPDGDQGFPGTLTATARYVIDDGDFSVEYQATTDRPTLVNLSNHAYWNLAGEGSAAGAMGLLLTIPAEHYLPTDAGAIPTGELRPVEGTPFDFRVAQPIGDRVRDGRDPQIRIGKGYDHNWVVARDVAPEPRLLARLEDPVSGRVMETWSNQPGLQFYSGNFLDSTSIGKSGRLYRMGDAVALEPQMFPDTPNRAEFGSLRLAPGQVYRNIIVWKFSTRRIRRIARRRRPAPSHRR
ncbi:MAG TPA: aldose epimerase family protein [Allosphingosinicella sp.]|nr:aldose epimerase family protein [Allosphingosinicella sp.]